MPAAETTGRPSNEVKFETRNPVVQRMIGGFFDRLRETVDPIAPASTLDAGCGEGETLVRLGPLLGERVAAVDLSAYSVDRVRERLPAVDARTASVAELPFADDAFDLVLCLEVLEHLDDPAAAVARAGPGRVPRRRRIGSPRALVPARQPAPRQVPRSLGNHPEHVNHFNRASLAALLEPRRRVREVAPRSRG